MRPNILNKYLIGASLLLIISIVVFFFLYKKVVSNKALANATEVQWKGELAAQEKIKTLKHSIDEVTKERDSFESHFAKSSDIVPFLDAIENMASSVSAKATITTVDITDNPPNLLIGITGSGTFDSLYKFMTLLENAAYELQITAFDLKKEGGLTDSGQPNWDLTLQVNVVSFSNK